MSIVLSDIRDRVGNITLNHPEKRNALGPEMIDALSDTIRTLLLDEGVKVVVLRSSSAAFCAGADLGHLSRIRSFSVAENEADSEKLRQLFDLIYNSNKIFISQVHGPALAGGCGLATICDFCFAAPEATFGYTEAKIGFVPALVMVYLMNRISGIHLRELLLTGKIITAEEAVEMGLVNRLLLAGDMDNEVHEFAANLCKTVSGSSVRYIKSMLGKLQGMQVKEALDFAVLNNAQARKEEDCIRGIDSFLNKQKIEW